MAVISSLEELSYFYRACSPFSPGGNGCVYAKQTSSHAHTSQCAVVQGQKPSFGLSSSSLHLTQYPEALCVQSCPSFPFMGKSKEGQRAEQLLNKASRPTISLVIPAFIRPVSLCWLAYAIGNLEKVPLPSFPGACPCFPPF